MTLINLSDIEYTYGDEEYKTGEIVLMPALGDSYHRIDAIKLKDKNFMGFSGRAITDYGREELKKIGRPDIIVADTTLNLQFGTSNSLEYKLFNNSESNRLQVINKSYGPNKLNEVDMELGYRFLHEIAMRINDNEEITRSLMCEGIKTIANDANYELMQDYLMNKKNRTVPSLSRLSANNSF